MKKTDRPSFLLTADLFSSSRTVLLNELKHQLSSGVEPLLIFTPNAEQVVQTKHNPKFASWLQQADILLPDGMGLVWGRNLLAKLNQIKSSQVTSGQTQSEGKGSVEIRSVQERISGVGVAQWLLNLTADFRLLVIGGRGYAQLPGLITQDMPQLDQEEFKKTQPSDSGAQLLIKAAETASELSINKSRISIESSSASTSNPNSGSNQSVWRFAWTPAYQQVQQTTRQEEERLQELILSYQPHILLVAFGAPWQERWVIEHRGLLRQANVKIALVVGGAMDVLLGKRKRAPLWMQNCGLEWMFRLAQQPWRWRRQLRLAKFVWLVLSNF